MNQQEKNQVIKDHYYDPKTGYQGLVKIFHKLKEQHPDIRLSDVRSFLEKQYTFQINRQQIRPKHYRTILANKPRDNYQMDLLVYDRYEYQGYKYILCCVDVSTRYACCRALKSRKVKSDNPDDEADKLLDKIKEIFTEVGKPKNLNVDQEFSRAKDLQDFFNDSNIKLHVSETNEINKQAIVERFNRTLALLFQKWRVATGQNNWPGVLDDLVKNYNNTWHRTIKATPKQLWDGEAKSGQTPIHVFETELVVGDKVRVKRIKKVFDKGDALAYSPELYVIIEKKDAVENGRKLKKFKLRNVETGQTLTDPRQWWKDYELKRQDAIVETIDEKPTDFTDKVEGVKEQYAKEVKELKQELAEKNKELEQLAPEEKKDVNYKGVKTKTDNQKDRLEKVKNVKSGVSYEERKKQLDATQQIALRNLTKVYGFDSSTKENPDIQFPFMRRLVKADGEVNPATGKPWAKKNKDGQFWKEKSMVDLRRDILKYEVAVGITPPPSK